MTGVWARLQVWVWMALLLLGAILLVTVIQIIRFVVKRATLLAKLSGDAREGRIALRPCRPLWWLTDRRRGYDCLVDIRDPETGKAAYTLAVKLIPTLRRTTEYCVGDMDRWRAKTNFLMPLPYGVVMLDFGYRRCRSRPVAKIFGGAPYGSIPTYVFHPHPHALTPEMRGDGRRYRHRKVLELSIPCRQEGVLMMDLDSLRRLAISSREQQEAIFGRETA